MKSSRGKATVASDASGKAPAVSSARDFVLSAKDAQGVGRGDWILDSGAIRHLVNDESLLLESSACEHQIEMADAESFCLKRVGSARLKVLERGANRM